MRWFIKQGFLTTFSDDSMLSREKNRGRRTASTWAFRTALLPLKRQKEAQSDPTTALTKVPPKHTSCHEHPLRLPHLGACWAAPSPRWLQPRGVLRRYPLIGDRCRRKVEVHDAEGTWTKDGGTDQGQTISIIVIFESKYILFLTSTLVCSSVRLNRERSALLPDSIISGYNENVAMST